MIFLTLAGLVHHVYLVYSYDMTTKRKTFQELLDEPDDDPCGPWFKCGKCEECKPTMKEK